MIKHGIVAGTLVLFSAVTAMAQSNIVETAQNSGSFKTLVKAVKAAGLSKTLSGKGPYTVFAPTDAAFEKLPAGTLQNLLQPENKEKLTEILTYHVVPGEYTSAKLKGKQTEVETVEGSQISVDFESGQMVENAQIVKADVQASNGVIHAIDTVIMPSG